MAATAAEPVSAPHPGTTFPAPLIAEPVPFAAP